MAGVTVEWLKWPDRPYRVTPTAVLGRDEVGTWLFAAQMLNDVAARASPSGQESHRWLELARRQAGTGGARCA